LHRKISVKSSNFAFVAHALEERKISCSCFKAVDLWQMYFTLCYMLVSLGHDQPRTNQHHDHTDIVMLVSSWLIMSTFACAQKLTNSQLNLPHAETKKHKE